MTLSESNIKFKSNKIKIKLSIKLKIKQLYNQIKLN